MSRLRVTYLPPKKKNFIFPISIKKNEAKDSKKSNNLEKNKLIDLLR